MALDIVEYYDAEISQYDRCVRYNCLQGTLSLTLDNDLQSDAGTRNELST